MESESFRIGNMIGDYCSFTQEFLWNHNSNRIKVFFYFNNTFFLLLEYFLHFVQSSITVIMKKLDKGFIVTVVSNLVLRVCTVENLGPLYNEMKGGFYFIPSVRYHNHGGRTVVGGQLD